MLFGNIQHRPGDVFLASVHEGGMPPTYELVGGELVEVPDGEWVRFEDLNRRLKAHDAFPSLQAAREWCAWHFQRAGEEVPDLEPGGDDGSWRLWPG